jgi:alcohol dehydrogenase YqhD (iron-dependent ADH family)
MRERIQRKVLIVYEIHPDEDIGVKGDSNASLEDFVKKLAEVVGADPAPVLNELRERGVDTSKKFAECSKEDWQILRDKVNETISKLDLKK